MKKQMTLWTMFAITLVLTAAPAFAQGKGGGIGQTKIGVGNNTHVDAPGIKAGKSTDVDDAKTKNSADVKAPEGKGAGKTDFITKIEANPKLSAKLQALIPGESLSTAATGFKNEGQFIAALHAAHNLNIPFDQLKASMTGSNPMSLGAAIKANRPGMSTEEANEQAKKAEKEAKENEKH